MEENDNRVADERVFQLKEVASFLGLTTEHVYKMVRRRELGSTRLGNGPRARWVVPDRDLQAYLAARYRGAQIP
jgi:excisionase family DNA binding protein